jgi:transketolase
MHHRPAGSGPGHGGRLCLAERHLNATFGDDLVDHKTFVIAGDGCLMEGINHEAIGLAGHLKLGRLIVLWDDNHITIDGDTSCRPARTSARAMRHRLACGGMRRP